MRSFLCVLLLLPVVASADIISVGVDPGPRNISLIPSAGASTANNVTTGNFVVQTFAPNHPSIPNSTVRPIMLFDKSAFAGLDPFRLTSASLSLRIRRNSGFGENGDVYASELRMFSTSEDLSFATRNTFAALTGDGGPATAIDTLVAENRAGGRRTINFDAADLVALGNLLLGADTKIGFSFRAGDYTENGGDPALLDGFLFRAGSVSLTVEGDPLRVAEPAALTLLGLGMFGLAAAARRRRDRQV